jgi:hypothetical protein
MEGNQGKDGEFCKLLHVFHILQHIELLVDKAC